MATIHKLTKDGSTIFPATITDAIVHPNTGKTLTSMIKDYNVSELFPTEGVDGGNKYNLVQAMVDQWSSDAGGTLASYQCSSTVYDDIFTS